MEYSKFANDAFQIVDTAITNFGRFDPIITCMKCAKRNCNIFGYGSNQFNSQKSSSQICDFMDPYITDIQFATTSDFAVFARDFGFIRMFDARNPSQDISWKLYDKNLAKISYVPQIIAEDFKLACSPDDRFIVTGTFDDRVKLIDLQSSPESRNLTIHMTSHLPDDSVRMSIDEEDGESSIPTLGWPRQLKVTKGSPDASENFGEDLNDPRWTMVSWKPNDSVFTAAHSEAIHIVEDTALN
ncbi:Serine/threonine-protein phosphatase 2A 55 kDa regulatory subunit B beta isoform [Cichlidogyrus casuarinus]|uniref:Serine/threonine-protein phosphatase 2A 55 kDa regulatory subunit B beta isoform n=1 Tax=Cichlidogyrus casuarinus TaxID=1844966 RepID=A0ABD2QL04_9PLAT